MALPPFALSWICLADGVSRPVQQSVSSWVPEMDLVELYQDVAEFLCIVRAEPKRCPVYLLRSRYLKTNIVAPPASPLRGTYRTVACEGAGAGILVTSNL